MIFPFGEYKGGYFTLLAMILLLVVVALPVSAFTIDTYPTNHSDTLGETISLVGAADWVPSGLSYPIVLELRHSPSGAVDYRAIQSLTYADPDFSFSWVTVARDNGKTVFWVVSMYDPDGGLLNEETGSYTVMDESMTFMFPPGKNAELLDHFKFLAYTLFGFETKELNNLVVAIGFIFLFTIAFGAYFKSSIGVVSGMVIGFFLSFYLGLIPVWIVIVLVILIGVLLIIMGRSGGGQP